jgi:transcriptional regulator with XRE-family HTH domain
MNIGKRIRELREAKGLTQTQLQHRSGMIRNDISRIENGHRVPTLESITRIANALEVPLYQIFLDPTEAHSDSGCSLRNAKIREAAKFDEKLREALSKMDASQRRQLEGLARALASKRKWRVSGSGFRSASMSLSRRYSRRHYKQELTPLTRRIQL